MYGDPNRGGPVDEDEPVIDDSPIAEDARKVEEDPLTNELGVASGPSDLGSDSTDNSVQVEADQPSTDPETTDDDDAEDAAR